MRGSAELPEGALATPLELYSAEHGLTDARAGRCVVTAALKLLPSGSISLGALDGEDTAAFQDLAPISSVLVSAGWNANDDVFLPAELHAAKDTPVGKPINMFHMASWVIGHITQSRAVDRTGNVVAADASPDDLDIEVDGVLYRVLASRSPGLGQLIADAERGVGFVSMEVLFPRFDYALREPDTGLVHVVARDETTAFLTKHLRRFSGSGKFKGYFVGRVLRDMIFSGMGVVNSPANPRSEFRAVADTDGNMAALCYAAASLEDLVCQESEGVIGMTEEEMKAKVDEAVQEIVAKNNELIDLRKKLDAAYTERDAIRMQLEALIKSQEAVQVADAEADQARKDMVKASEETSARLAEVEGELAEAVARADKAEAEFVAAKARETARDRLAQLAKVADVDDAEATLASISDLSDEAFRVVLQYAGRGKAGEDAAGSDDDAAKILDSARPDGTGAVISSETDEDIQIGTARAVACRVLRVPDESAE